MEVAVPFVHLLNEVRRNSLFSEAAHAFRHVSEKGTQGSY